MDWTKIAKKVRKELKKDKKYRDKEFKDENGFYKEEAWNLDKAAALYILPRLAFLSANHAGTAVDESNDDTIDYNKVLDTMVKGFYLYAFKNGESWTKEEKELWQITKKYFMEFFECLWD